MNNTPKPLLEVLCAQAGLSYLSDLGVPGVQAQIRAALQSLPASDYSLADWQGAYAYIVKNNTQFTNADEARNALLQTLAK